MDLKAICVNCAETYSTEVTPADWIRYTSGAFVQVVWPDSSVEHREICIANRPNNPFGDLGFWCEACSDESL